MKAQVTEKTAEEILEYRRAGFTIKDIASFVGLSNTCVNTWLSRHLPKEERRALALNSIKQNKNNSAMIYNHKEAARITGEETPAERNSKEYPATKEEAKAPVKEKTLKDFQARDMIKHLYNMGYRIENNQLVCLVKQAVNLKDIINS
ncbi:MAG: hypothetical protein IKR80_00735 [Spirochaetales bacterium]|nr:hypothetical protein [Spirochaetales bacterium]